MQPTLSHSHTTGKTFLKANTPAIVFFALYLVLGLFIFRDYGMSFDEHWGRENGLINARFIVETIAPGSKVGKDFCHNCVPLAQYQEADHGPVFEIATVFLERVFKLRTNQEIFRMRHLCSFLLFYTGTVFFYLLLLKRFRKPLLALAGVLMLVLSPRFFAESFYNAKDIPFLSMAIISSYTFSEFFQKKNWQWAITHALACGIMIDIRILGLLFPALTIFFLLFDLKIFRSKATSLPKTGILLLTYLVSLFCFMVTFWPYLWQEPFARFARILARSSSYPWNNDVLYLGKFYPASQLPWHYLPVWIFISTPLVYISLALCGLFFLAKLLVKNRFRLYANTNEQTDLAMGVLFLAPIAATIILKLVLYDSWRHMYFLYAGLIYTAVLGLFHISEGVERHFAGRKSRLLQNSALLLLGISLLKTASWMLVNHPHQNVYFSALKGPKVRQEIELDYWGLSYRQGLQYVLSHSDKPQIKIHVNLLSGGVNKFLFSPETVKRLKYVDKIEDAEYSLTEYRWHPQDYPYKPEQEVFQITVDGYKIMSVFKLK